MDVLALVVAALVTGFLGSLHCVGMCGAIACSKMLFVGVQHQANLPAAVKEKGGQPIFLYSLLFNLSRIITYAILGAAIGFLGQKLVLNSQLDSIALGVRLGGAILIALIGLRFLINLRWVDKIEVLGLRVWRYLKPNKSTQVSTSANATQIIVLGLLWGLLPCALVYTMLLTATSSGSTWSGALIMLAFGVGTLPAMLGMSFFADSVRVFVQKPWLRQLFGIALIIIAVYVFAFNLNMDHSDHSGHSGHAHYSM